MHRTIAIGGCMGVGKTTVGRQLALELGCEFFDLDHEIVLDAGQDIQAIFERGEGHFRRLEARTLARVLSCPPHVLALGGGTLHFDANLEHLRASTQVFVLNMPLAAISDRLGRQDSTRPLWAVGAALYEARKERYHQAGQLLEIEGLNPKQVVAKLMEILS